jgi:hypothetical protein
MKNTKHVRYISAVSKRPQFRGNGKAWQVFGIGYNTVHKLAEFDTFEEVEVLANEKGLKIEVTDYNKKERK